MDPSDTNIARYGSLYIFLTVVVGVAVIGFFRGTAPANYHSVAEPAAHEEAEDHDHAVPLARSYSQMRRTPRGEGSGFDADLARMRGVLPGQSDSVDLSGTSKAVDLVSRAERRAYDGAPPVIPHPVRQRSASECAACHEEGLRVGSHQAPAFPHASYQVCVQCHAMAEPNAPFSDGIADPRAVPNSFAGLAAPTEGPRWSVAAPTIPHKTHMRERCDSCHGVSGRDAIRSTHPWRQNCEQCHAPNSGLEWRPGGLQ